jgi:hypothetical protein
MAIASLRKMWVMTSFLRGAIENYLYQHLDQYFREMVSVQHCKTRSPLFLLIACASAIASAIIALLMSFISFPASG